MSKIKTTALLAVLLVILLSAISCKAEPHDISEKNWNINIDESVKNNMSIINTCFTNSFTKIQPNTQINYNTDYKIYSAKNETESCQLVLYSENTISSLIIETEMTDNLYVEVLREYYIGTQPDTYYPDPLAPVTDNFTLKGGENLTFLIKFKTTENAVAGEYNIGIKIRQNSNDSVINEVALNVVVHVWDFTLPDASSCATAVGLYPQFINKLHGITIDDKQREMYKSYYDYLLENRVCAYSIPYDILDNRSDEYLDNPRVSNLVVPYSDNDDTIVEYYKKLSSKPEWFAKAVFYPLDEPTSKEHLDTLKSICDRLDRLYPGYQLVTPFFTNIRYNNSTDQIDFMTGHTNIWCPKTYMYITSNIYSDEQIQKYPPFGNRMEKRKKAGDRIWWYVCWEPGDPYCNLFLDMEGIMHRLLFWQQKLYDVDGFLYWGANYWQGVDDPWTDMRTVKDLSMDVFGDGSLLYNGNRAGIDGPVGSLRLEAIRDGIEDFEMFSLAEKYLGRDYIVNTIGEMTTSIIKYSKSEDKFMSIRIKIGEMLEKAVLSAKSSKSP